MKPVLAVLTLCALLSSTKTAFSATIVKSSSEETVTLSQGEAWEGGVAPTSGDIATWSDLSLVAGKTWLLGGDVAWNGIALTTNMTSSSTMVIGGDETRSTLTLGSGGISIKPGASANVYPHLTLDANVCIAENQSWVSPNDSWNTAATLVVKGMLTGSGNLSIGNTLSVALDGDASGYTGALSVGSYKGFTFNDKMSNGSISVGAGSSLVSNYSEEQTINGTFNYNGGDSDENSRFSVNNGALTLAGTTTLKNVRVSVGSGATLTFAGGTSLKLNALSLGNEAKLILQGTQTLSAALTPQAMAEGEASSIIVKGNVVGAYDYTINSGVTLDLSASSGKLFATSSGGDSYTSNKKISVSAGGTLILRSLHYGASLGGLADYAERRELNGGTMIVTGESSNVGSVGVNVTSNGGAFLVENADTIITFTGRSKVTSLAGSASAFAVEGRFILGGAGSIALTPNANTGYDLLTGSGEVIKQGSGTLFITGSNLGYTGNMTIEEGIVSLGNENALGSSGTLTLGEHGILDLNNHHLSKTITYDAQLGSKLRNYENSVFVIDMGDIAQVDLSMSTMGFSDKALGLKMSGQAVLSFVGDYRKEQETTGLASQFCNTSGSLSFISETERYDFVVSNVKNSSGAIYAYSGLVIDGLGVVELSGNTVGDDSFNSGAAITVDNGDVTVTNTHLFKLTHNGATSESVLGVGSAMSVSQGAVSISANEVVFTDNVSNNQGGALTAENGLVNFESGMVSMLRNEAKDGSGGAVYAVLDLIFSGTNLSLSHNEASENGGALYSRSELRLNQVSGDISYNIAGENGGALSGDSVSIIANDTLTFRGNVASLGGAIYADSSVSLVAKGGDIVFEDNEADAGGALYLGLSHDEDTGAFVGHLNFAAEEGKSIIFKNSVMTDDSGSVVFEINELNQYTGTVEFAGGETSEIYGDTRVSYGTMCVSEGSTFATKSLEVRQGVLSLNNGYLDTISLGEDAGNMTIQRGGTLSVAGVSTAETGTLTLESGSIWKFTLGEENLEESILTLTGNLSFSQLTVLLSGIEDLEAGDYYLFTVDEGEFDADSWTKDNITFNGSFLEGDFSQFIWDADSNSMIFHVDSAYKHDEIKAGDTVVVGEEDMLKAKQHLTVAAGGELSFSNDSTLKLDRTNGASLLTVNRGGQLTVTGVGNIVDADSVILKDGALFAFSMSDEMVDDVGLTFTGDLVLGGINLSFTRDAESGALESGEYVLFQVLGHLDLSQWNEESLMISGLGINWNDLFWRDQTLYLMYDAERDPAFTRACMTATWIGEEGDGKKEAAVGTWKVGGTTYGQWKLSKKDADTRFRNGDAVVISNYADITIEGNVAPASLTVDSNYEVSLSGEGHLVGKGGIIKKGKGELILDTENFYSGGTIIYGGTVTASDSSLGTGMITLRAGTLNLMGSHYENNVLFIYGKSTVEAGEASLQSLVVKSTLLLSDDMSVENFVSEGTVLGGSLHIAQNAIVSKGTLDTSIIGAKGLIKSDKGTLTLTGDYTFAGETTIDAGSFVLKEASYHSDIQGKDKITLDLKDASSLTGEVHLGAGSSVRLSELSSLKGETTLGEKSSITLSKDAHINGSVILGDSSKITGSYESSLTGDATLGEKSSISLSKDFSLEGNIVLGNDSKISSSLGTIVGNMSLGEKSSVSFSKEDTVRGNITLGDSGKVSNSSTSSIEGLVTLGNKVKLENKGKLQGNIFSLSDSRVTNSSYGTILGNITLQDKGYVSNAGQIEGNITMSSWSKISNSKQKIDGFVSIGDSSSLTNSGTITGLVTGEDVVKVSSSGVLEQGLVLGQGAQVSLSSSSFTNSLDLGNESKATISGRVNEHVVMGRGAELSLSGSVAGNVLVGERSSVKLTSSKGCVTGDVVVGDFSKVSISDVVGKNIKLGNDTIASIATPIAVLEDIQIGDRSQLTFKGNIGQSLTMGASSALKVSGSGLFIGLGQTFNSSYYETVFDQKGKRITTISGNVLMNGGTWNWGGKQKIGQTSMSGNLTLNSGTIGLDAQHQSYDQLWMSGKLTLAGEVELRLSGSWSAGDYTLMNFGSSKVMESGLLTIAGLSSDLYTFSWLGKSLVLTLNTAIEELAKEGFGDDTAVDDIILADSGVASSSTMALTKDSSDKISLSTDSSLLTDGEKSEASLSDATEEKKVVGLDELMGLIGGVDLRATQEAVLNALAGNSMWATSQTIFAFGDAMRERNVVPTSEDQSVWVSSLSQFTHQKDGAVSFGGDFQTTGYAVGTDWAMTKNLTGGIAFAQSWGKNKLNESMATIDQNMIMGGVYAEYMVYENKRDQVWLLAQGMYGSSSDAASLYTGDQTSWDETAGGFDLRGVWSHELETGTSVNVYAGLQWARVSQEAYGLTLGQTKASISTSHLNVLNAPVGLGLSRTIILSGEQSLVFYGNVSVVPELARSTPDAMISTEEGVWKDAAASPGHISYRLRGGLAYAINRSWSVNGSYQIETSKNHTNQSVNVGVGYAF